MSNDFGKEERVAFDELVGAFEDSLVLSKMVSKYQTNQTTMERTNDAIWRPVPYIAQTYDGADQTTNFQNITQLLVPSTIGYRKSAPWTMDDEELRDSLQEQRFGEAAKHKLASDINVSVMNVAAQQGTLVVKRTAAATGFDDVAQCDAIMNEQGVMDYNRYLGLSTRDYNGMANNLATRTLGNSPKSLNAYEKAYVGDVSGFDTYKFQYANRLTAAAGTTVTINGANQYYTPTATSTATTGETSNVDNRYQTLALAVGGGTVAVGDCFTIAGVNAVHHITKEDTGQLKTFRIIEIISGAGGTGSVKISPAIVSNGGGTDAEAQYKNVTATPANGAAVTFLNTVTNYVNPFWYEDSIEILPATLAAPNAGANVMRATTENGFTIQMVKQLDINTNKTKYRIDAKWGVVMKNPEMAGIMMFSQT